MSTSADDTLTASEQNPVRVLLVEDSGIVRAFFRKFIEHDHTMKVAAVAGNGQLGIDTVKSAEFDVVVLDIEMPVMDGLTALPLILEADPDLQVIVASTLTKENAVITMKCLEAGAAECLAKPTAQDLVMADAFREQFVQKVKTLGLVTRRKRKRRGVKIINPSSSPASAPIISSGKPGSVLLQPKPAEIVLRKPVLRMAPELVVIGSSTGGPQALMKFFADLRRPLQQPVLVTQHMPPTFTTILAEHIAKNTGLACHEAKDGERIEGGVIYVAPGNYHLNVKSQDGKKFIVLNQDPPENFCRPSVDHMLRSVLAAYGRRVLAVMLTGMGTDGLKGCQELADAGGTVVAQDEATSVVWGMPGAVAKAGICSAVLPLDGLAGEVRGHADRMVTT